MNVQRFAKQAKELNDQYKRLREQLTCWAATTEGREALKAINKPVGQATIIKKLFYFPADITPSRLETIGRKLLERKTRK